MELPVLKHKYINTYDTNEEYESDKVNYEEVNYSLVKSELATDKNFSEYQFSIRTTNNDNLKKGKYWSFENINIYAGLDIIWGYFGWQYTDYEYEGEILKGGNFTITKPMTIVKNIPDGSKLQHINNFLRYANNNSINKIEYFDTSNIKIASYVFYNITNDCIIDQNILKKWTSLEHIINIFTKYLNIYNNLNDGDIVDFSNLKEGSDYITNLGHNNDNYEVIAEYNYHQFNKLIKFKFGNLQDNIFRDILSYNIIKTLYNKNIFEYTFNNYILNLNNTNCEIYHIIPVYDNFIYNLYNEANYNFIIYLYTDFEYENKICNLTFNINNFTGNKLHIIGNNNNSYGINQNNIYNINIESSEDIIFTDFYYYQLNDNNIIINKTIEKYSGNVKFYNCIINKDINATGTIINCTINGNINNIESLNSSVVNGSANIKKIYNNVNITGDLILNNQSGYNNKTNNNIVNGDCYFTGSSTFNNFTCRNFYFKGISIALINSTINNIIFDYENLIDSTYYSLTIDNCIINTDIIILNNPNNYGLYVYIKNQNINLSIDNASIIEIINSTGNYNITNIKNSGIDSLLLDNSSILFNDTINIIDSFNVEINNSFSSDNDYIFKNLTGGYIYISKITYNKDNYDVSEAKIYSINTSVYKNTIVSNIAIYDIVGININAKLNNQEYTNIYINNRSNKNDRVNISINSISINTINIYYNYLYNSTTSITNIINNFYFNNCDTLININCQFGENFEYKEGSNTAFDFTNCMNINPKSLYNFLMAYIIKVGGSHVVNIENAVYVNITEEQINNLLQYYEINIIHQD